MRAPESLSSVESAASTRDRSFKRTRISASLCAAISAAFAQVVPSSTQELRDLIETETQSCADLINFNRATSA